MPLIRPPNEYGQLEQNIQVELTGNSRALEILTKYPPWTCSECGILNNWMNKTCTGRRCSIKRPIDYG